MAKKLFMGNLNFKLKEDSLIQFVEESGFKVVSAKIAKERDTGRSRGYAFVEIDGDDAVLKQAIERMDGVKLEGRPLTVDAAKDKPKK